MGSLKYRALIIILSLVVVAHAGALQDYYCGSDLTKSNLVTNEQAAEDARADMAEAFDIDMTGQLEATHGDFLSLVDKIEDPIGPYVAPFAIGLAVAVFIWPFLLACCLCPDKCPAKVLQQPDGKPYTKIELLWPVVVLLFIFVSALILCCVGLSMSSVLTNGLRAPLCGASMLIEEFSEGGTSDDGELFHGMDLLKEQINYLNGNMSGVLSQISTVQTSAMTTEMTTVDDALDEISMIPDASKAQMTDITYCPLLVDPTSCTASIVSEFPATLGTFDAAGSLT